MDSLPEAVLIQILASIPAVELVLACRLVCCQWKNLVDGAALWTLKCQQEGFTGAEPKEEAENWQTFYFLKNLEHWGEVENGGDGWKIEDLPGDFGKEFPSDGVHKYFVTSYEWCRKSQVIDLRAEGYWEELMDTTQPKIVVKDCAPPQLAAVGAWNKLTVIQAVGALLSGHGLPLSVLAVERCPAQAQPHYSAPGLFAERPRGLHVKLLSEHEDVLAEYQSDTVAIPQDNAATWTELSHTFSNYGPGARFVRFEHGGQDTLFWKGWYGVRVTNSSVMVEP
ncbi:F-box only protein 2 [Chelonia mydas]|uniref:F-box only protein 2 n=1 Tax=Chelonia mydas TaxID=8469 RepID=M7CA47_CHEMY|nr:F-box only protein 2 [Chelonia mydas]